MFASAKFSSALSLLLLLTSFCTSASNAETPEKQIQKHLSSLGYNIGAIDGIFGNLSKKALAKHLGVKSKDLPKNFNQEFTEQILRVANSKGIPWQFYDNFETIKYERYDTSHLTRKIASAGNAKILTEANGNNYIALASQPGQLSHFNDQKRYLKDRVELGTNGLLARYDLEGRTLWYGFNIKSTEKNFSPKAEKITITQMKQILTNERDEDCAPGIFWRLNIHGEVTEKPSWAAVTNNYDRIVTRSSVPNFITDEWSRVKVGIYFSETQEGWLRAYVNGKQIIDHSGRTVMSETFSNCKVADKTNWLRIGLYRGTDRKFLKNAELPHDQRDELHFDNFIVTDTELKVDAVLF